MVLYLSEKLRDSTASQEVLSSTGSMERSAKTASQNRQRLTPEEELVVARWILRLQRWGWPPRVEQTRRMVEDMLVRKGDTEPLGVNWIQKFLRHHPDIKSIYIPPLDKERSLAQDPEILSGWYSLFQSFKDEYNVQIEDIYNMDEKGFAQGVIGKLKVMISKYEKKKYMTQCGNREWVSLIECVSMDGRVLRPWIIFKAVLQQKAWHDALPEAHFSTSENGWTDNELGFFWFVNCFEKETTATQKGEYRILCLDGHASHVSSEVIDFCVARKIILLCLPAHTTHILQPLDVGIFAPLAAIYKNLVHRTTLFGASYSIDKVDFLELYGRARTEAITPVNIYKAWEKAGLLPFNHELVHYRLPQKDETNEQYNVTIRPTTPPEATISYSGPEGYGQVTLTPANTLQVQQLLKQATSGQDLTHALQKVGKAAIVAMAEAAVQSATNNEFLELNKKKDRKASRSKVNYGVARYLGDDARKEREERAKNKRDEKAIRRSQAEWNKEIKRLGKLAPQLFEAPPPRKVQVPKTPKTPKKATSVRELPQTPGTPLQLVPSRPLRLIVRLLVRVSTQELQQGRWGQPRQAQQKDGGEQLGRGQRLRKPAKGHG